MSEPLETSYFNWLYSNVSDISERLPALRFTHLLRSLHETEFIFLLSGDDNRVQDGRDLRVEFLLENDIDPDGALQTPGCSILEMLISFSRIASFETDESARDWFWTMISNLGLSSVNDATPYNEKAVSDILDRLVWRTYDRKGNGGLFPLTNTKHDQRKVEIWYQFNEYLFELDYD